MLDKIQDAIEYTFNVGPKIIVVICLAFVMVPIFVILVPFALIGFLCGAKVETKYEDEGW